MSSFLFYLAPVLMAAVAIILLLGLLNMVRGGGSNLSQRLMRARVLMQFAAVVVMLGAVYFVGT